MDFSQDVQDREIGEVDVELLERIVRQVPVNVQYNSLFVGLCGNNVSPDARELQIGHRRLKSLDVVVVDTPGIENHNDEKKDDEQNALQLASGSITYSLSNARWVALKVSMSLRAIVLSHGMSVRNTTAGASRRGLTAN